MIGVAGVLHAPGAAGFAGTLGVLLAIIVAARLGGEIAARLGQPAVLGELLAGAVAGPFVLGLVDTGTEAASPIGVLAELGVLLLLFDVGLEIDLRDFARVGIRAVGVAVIGVAAPLVLGTAGALLTRLGGGAWPVAIFVGGALTATSVGITARVFADLGALGTAEARTVIGAAVVDDVLGLIVLTVVVQVATPGAGLSGLAVGGVILKAAAFLGVGVAVGAALAPRLFDLLDRRLRLPGATVTAAFALALGYAVAAERLAGLAGIVGAFAAGVVVARSGHGHEVREALGPMGRLLVPVFFLSVGASVDPAAFFTASTALPLAVLLVAAVAGKLVAGLGARGVADPLVVGVGMVPRGEVGLIFAGVGVAAGILDAGSNAVVVGVVALTTVLGPPLLKSLVSRRLTGVPLPSAETALVLAAAAPSDLAREQSAMRTADLVARSTRRRAAPTTVARAGAKPRRPSEVFAPPERRS